jgi:hypothetical protein
MTTERAQDATVHRVFLRKELSRFARIFAELSHALKDPNLLFVSFDEVDEIDVLLEDSLWCGAANRKKKKTLSRNGKLEGRRRVATHGATFSKGVRNGVDSQDTTELVPVVDVLFVGPIQIVEFFLDGDVESEPRGSRFQVVFVPIVFLAQTVEFGNGRTGRLRLEFGVLREKALQWCCLA